MPYDNNTFEIIDKFLAGELDGKELEDFQKRIDSDSILAREIASQKELLDAMNYHDKTSELKSKLNEIHEGIDLSQIKNELGLINNKMGRIKRYRLVATISIAASISLIVTFSSLFISGWFNYNKDNHLDVYTELRKEIKDISSTQETMQKAITNKEGSKKLIRYNGTGFAISSNGYLVTNYHVVKNVDSILIVNKSDSLIKYHAKLIYKELKNDLAILKVDDESFETFGTLPYTFKEEVSDMGEYVYTLGYSKSDIVFNEGSISATTGYRGDTTAYQISIPVNPGNSGGPLIDEKGYMLGIVSGKHSRKAGTTFAIKSSYLVNIIDSIEVDSLSTPPELPKNNALKWYKRTEQIKRVKPFIYKVEVYK